MTVFHLGMVAAVLVFGALFLLTRVWLRKKMYFSICLNALELFAGFMAVIWAGNVVNASYEVSMSMDSASAEARGSTGEVPDSLIYTATVLCLALLAFALMVVRERRKDIDAQLARGVPIEKVTQ
jgi:multisubunit Na+/H+ antiporter MnhC subunit